jgi:hypothetical protein
MNTPEILLTIGNVIVMTSIFHQLYKNNKYKNCRSQNHFWQIQTLIGYSMFLCGYWYLDLLVPFLGVFFNVCLKCVLLTQILYYNRKSNRLETWV